jgi:hypothetical protein
MTPFHIRRGHFRSVSHASLLFASAAVSVAARAFAAPTPHNCAAASEDALALRKQDKLGAAKERLLVCTDPACPAEIRDECAHRLTDVTDAIPSVVFDVKDEAGNDVLAVRVSMDGALLVDHIGAAALSVDPGEHTFRFDGANASQSVERKFVIRDGEKNRHLAIAFGPSGGVMAATVPLPAVVAGPPLPSLPVPEQPSASSWSSQKSLALVAGGVGIVGIGVGSVFGAMTFSQWSKSKSECAASCAPGSQAQSDKNSASSSATISDVGFIAGGVLIVGGAVLWFTAPSGAQLQVTPTASAQGAGFTLRGAFQ